MRRVCWWWWVWWRTERSGWCEERWHVDLTSGICLLRLCIAAKRVPDSGYLGQQIERPGFLWALNGWRGPGVPWSKEFWFRAVFLVSVFPILVGFWAFNSRGLDVVSILRCYSFQKTA